MFLQLHSLVTNESIPTTVVMPRYKKPASRLKDLSRFQGYKAEEKYEVIIKSLKILYKKGFHFPPRPSGITQTLCAAIVKKRLTRVLQPPKRPCATTGQRIPCKHIRTKSANNLGKKLSHSLRPPSPLLMPFINCHLMWIANTPN